MGSWPYGEAVGSDVGDVLTSTCLAELDFKTTFSPHQAELLHRCQSNERLASGMQSSFDVEKNCKSSYN